MGTRLNVWPERPRIEDGQIIRSCQIEHASIGRKQLWYRIPEAQGTKLSVSDDHFAVGAVFHAMLLRCEVRIHGRVSPGLLCNLHDFTRIWSCWRPEQFGIVSFEADAEDVAKPSDRAQGALSTFSGGVDSCSTVFRRAGQNPRGRLALTAALMIHGFDIPLSRAEDFRRAAARSQTIVASRGVEFLTLATNFRELLPLSWEDQFGAGLASCLLHYQEQYSAALIPASYSYHRMTFPYGSNPITDALLTNDYFPIVHEGAEFSRADKCQQLLGWPEALKNLRVCWEGADKGRNCSRCEKCVRTILNFRIQGAVDLPCFDHEPTAAEIRRLRTRGAQLDALENLVSSAVRSGISPPWLPAVRQCIRRNQRIESVKRMLPTPLWHKLKQWYQQRSVRRPAA